MRNVSDRGRLHASSKATIATWKGPGRYGHSSKQILNEIVLPLTSVALVIEGRISLTFFLNPIGIALILTFSLKLSSSLEASGSETCTSMQRSSSATVLSNVTCMLSLKVNPGSPSFLPRILGGSALGHTSTTNI